MSKNVVKGADRVHAYDWLREIGDRASQCTARELAAELSEVLGANVTVANIHSFRADLGIECVRVGGGVPRGLTKRVSDLEAFAHQVEAWIRGREKRTAAFVCPEDNGDHEPRGGQEGHDGG